MAKLATAASADQKFQLSTDGFAPYNYAVCNQLEGATTGNSSKSTRRPLPKNNAGTVRPP